MTTQGEPQTREELRLRGMSRKGALPIQLHVQIGADSPDEFDPLGNWRPVVPYHCALPNDVTPYTGLWTSTLRTGTNGPLSAFWMARSDTLRGKGYFWKIVPGPGAYLLQIDSSADYETALRHYPDARSGGLDFAALAGDFDLVHLTQRGAAQPSDIAHTWRHECALWLRPVFARPPELIFESAPDPPTTFCIPGTFPEQWVTVRALTPRAMRALRVSRNATQSPEPIKAMMPFWRMMIDELIVSHTLRDWLGAPITTVGDGLCDELAQRNIRLLTTIVRGLPGAPPGAPRWQQRSPRS